MPLALLLNSRQNKVLLRLLLLLLPIVIPYITITRAAFVICLFLQKLMANAYAYAQGSPKFCSCSAYKKKTPGFYKAIF